MKVFNFIVRIFGLPFVLGLILVRVNFNALYIATLFLLHGGEWSSYRKDEKKKIFDLYEKLSEMNEKPH